MKDMQTKIVMIGILLSTGIMLRAQDNGGCEDCPAFNAGGKVEVRGVKERIIGDLSQPVAVRVRTLIQQMTLAEKVAQLAEELIEQYKAEHNGECPPKVTINLWAVECIRNEGTMEAQALSLLGVRPVYNASNQVVGLELIPQHELKRPRVDVVFAPSGLYRDIFPELMALLDKAVSLARSADEKDNFVREHILESEDKLKQLGVQEDSLARRIASVRLFTTPSGAYGTGVSGTVQASGTWEDEKDVAEVYFDKMSHLYGQGFWGTKVEDEYTYLPKGFSKTVYKHRHLHPCS